MLSGPEFREAAARHGLKIFDKRGDTDFRKAIERTGFAQNHHVAFGGGNDQNNFRGSIGNMDNKMGVNTHSYRNYIAKLEIRKKAFANRLPAEPGPLRS